MLYNELLAKLIYLTNRNDLTHVEIGRCIGLDKGAITARSKRNSKFKTQEIEMIEEFFDVQLNDIEIKNKKNTLERQNDETLREKVSGLGFRLQEIQDKHNFLDREMSKLLKLSEKDYIKLKLGKLLPDINTINEIKRNFVVDIDWLLYG